MKDNVRD